jgi:hypothetical protein
MAVRSELKSRVLAALTAASCPTAIRDAQLAASPRGVDSSCEVGDVRRSAGDARGVHTATDVPCSRAEQVADTVLSCPRLTGSQ